MMEESGNSLEIYFTKEWSDSEKEEIMKEIVPLTSRWSVGILLFQKTSAPGQPRGYVVARRKSI